MPSFIPITLAIAAVVLAVVSIVLTRRVEQRNPPMGAFAEIDGLRRALEGARRDASAAPAAGTRRVATAPYGVAGVLLLAGIAGWKLARG